MDCNKKEQGGRTLEKIKVSVIIPTFARSIPVARAVRSAVEQSHRNLEIIVVDDNADECMRMETLRAVSALGDERVVYISNGRNLGAARSRNAGIEKSSGAYITFLDDDDVYDRDKVERQLAYMLENNLDFCFSSLRMADEHGKIREIRSRDFITEFSRENLMVENLLHHISSSDTFMSRRETLFEAGLFPDERIGEDYRLLMKVIESGARIGCSPHCGVTAFLHGKEGGVSTGREKIAGERAVYQFSRGYFHLLTKKQIRYVKMRYYLVLSYVYFKYHDIRMLPNLVLSFCHSPGGFCGEVLQRVRRGRAYGN